MSAAPTFADADDARVGAQSCNVVELSRTRLRSICGGSLGNLIEYYDWFAYASFALYFAPTFFPAADRTTQLLNTSGIFALGFLMRPVGAWLLGRAADRYGRKPTLIASVSLMCLGSTMIAATPGYARIGHWAPALLVAARMLQGMSVGGEFGTSATYLAEIAPDERRGFWASFHYVTMILGQLLALGVLLLLRFMLFDEAQIESWAWRLPFALGAALAIAVFYIRRGIAEAPEFLSKRRASGGRPGLPELLKHWRVVLLVFGMSVGSNVAFYSFTTYMQKYLVVSVGFPIGQASLICTAGLIVFAAAQPAAGWVSDVMGRKPLLLWFGVGGALFTVPLMTLIGRTHDALAAFGLSGALLLMLAGGTSIGATVKAELFPAVVRTLGVGLPFAISQSIFAGTAEYVALSFKALGHESGFFWYVSGCIGISLIAFLYVPETRWSSQIATVDRLGSNQPSHRCPERATHMDMYHRPQFVGPAVEKLAAFFGKAPGG
jgi:MFS transporter, MHS family, alpha-ketoglutarate permease